MNFPLINQTLQRTIALVPSQTHIPRLVDDRLFGLKDETGKQLKAE